MASPAIFTLVEKHELSHEKIPQKGIPLWRYWHEFVEKHTRAGGSFVTVTHVKESLRLVIHHTQLLTLEIWEDFINAENTLYRLKEKRNWSHSTLWTHVKNLKTYFNFLKKYTYIVDNPLEHFTKIRITQPEQYTLSSERAKAVLGHLNTRPDTRFIRLRNSLFFHILFLTGARPIELLSLKLTSFSSDRSKLGVQGAKQKMRPRYYNLSSQIRDLLKQYLQHVSFLGRQVEVNNHLFLSSSKRNTGWTRKGLDKLCQRLSKELGFKVNSYAFRRMVATELNRAGEDIKTIQRHLGHTRQSTTERYIERSACLTEAGTKRMQALMSI